MEETYRIKQFKDGSNNFWCGNYHFTILNGELIMAAGGIETEEARNKMITYLKKKKLL